MKKSNEKIAVGIDIGTTKVVAMIGKKNEYGKVEILGVGKAKSLGVSKGVVSNINLTIQSIQQAVTEAEEKSGYKIGDCIAGIAGQHIRSLQYTDYINRKNPDEVINENDIQSLTEQVGKLAVLNGEEIIHVLPQEYKIDGQSEIFEPIGMYGRRLEASFHVVVGQAASIKNLAKCIQSADIELSGLTLEPLASSESVLSLDEKEAGVALIDIGGGTTDLAIFKDGIIRHTAVIPFGGNIITEDIKEGCSIMQRQAEALKTKFGSAWPIENKENEIVSIPGIRNNEPKEISLKNLSRIINARMIEIIEQVFAEIQEYGSENPKKKLIAGIVLTGGGSELLHVKQLVEFITGMSARIGYPNEHLSGNSSEQFLSPTYATVVGLVMNGIENNKQSAYKLEVTNISNQTTNVSKEEFENTSLTEENTKIQEKKEEEITTQATDENKQSFMDKFFLKIKKILDETD